MRTFHIFSKSRLNFFQSNLRKVHPSYSKLFSTGLSHDNHLCILKNQLSQANKNGSSNDVSKALSNLTNYYNYLFINQKKLSILCEWIPTLKDEVCFVEKSGSKDISALENLRRVQDLLKKKHYKKDCDVQGEELDNLLKPHSLLNTDSEKKTQLSKPTQLGSIQSVFQYLIDTVAGVDSSIENILRKILVPRLSEGKIIKNARIKCEKGILLYGPPRNWKNLFCYSTSQSVEGKN